MKKLNIALLFGGNSSEHDVSKRSARNIYDAMNKDLYNITVFLIAKNGFIMDKETSQRVFNGENEDELVNNAMNNIDINNSLAPIEALSKEEIDLFYPVIHGNLGEDGTLQGLFRTLQKPYIGSNISASSIAFDKDLTKKILNASNIRNTKYILLTNNNKDKYSFKEIKKYLNSDVMFIKAARQGSSVGIYRVNNEKDYIEGIEEAFKYDRKVLIEAGLIKPKEVFISILGNENPKASKIGGISLSQNNEWYDYQNKFVDSSGIEFEVPITLPEILENEITQMALKAYKELGLTGLARIDFLIDENNVPYLGEPNTLPGFTNISLYPQLWNVSGLEYTELIDEIVKYGLEEFKNNDKLSYDFIKLDKE